MTKISVVIPLYNKAAYIMRAVGSVLAQTKTDFEVIVVNDGSTDGGDKILAACLDPRVRCLSQINSGVSAARNRGIAESKYDYVAFLDADDEWTDDFLETISLLINKYPQAGVYALGHKIINSFGAVRFPRCYGIPRVPWDGIIPDYFQTAALGPAPVCASAVCVPKTVLSHVGGFPVLDSLGEDQDLWCRISLRWPIAYSNKIGAIYYLNADNRACSNHIPSEELPFTQRLQELLDGNVVPRHLRPSVRLFIDNQLFSLVLMNIKSGEQQTALKLLQDPRLSAHGFRKIKLTACAYFPPIVVRSLRAIMAKLKI